MTHPVIRPATPLDAGAVGGILSEFAETTPWMPRLHTCAEDIAFAGHMIDRGWVSVAHADGTVTGFLARDGAEINALYLTAPARGQGLGARLLDHAKAASDRLELWTFQANIGAQRFYLRHGFTEAQRTEGHANDEGLPDIEFCWTRG